MAADSEFVFDAVVGFLTSPIWNTPVVTFIEQECLVFDRDEQEYDAYKEIHERYKQMVEMLLSSFVKDIGITAEQFTTACKARGGNAQFNDIHKNVFEQVWAAEDFEVFKRLMIQKNVELQLQALQLIQQRGHLLSQGPENDPQQSSKPTTTQNEGVDEEDALMQEVLRLSKVEYDNKSKEEKKEEEELEKTLAHSKEEHNSPSFKPKTRSLAKKDTPCDFEASKNLTKALEEAENALEIRLRSIAEREQEQMEKALKSCIISPQEPQEEPGTKEVSQKNKSSVSKTSPTSTPALPSLDKPEVTQTSAGKEVLPPLTASKTSTSSSDDAAANWMSSARAEASTASTSTSQQETELTESELKRRTEYLKQQRDKLLLLKKQEREKKLHKYTEEQPKSKARPTSARTARRVTAGERVTSPSPASPSDEKKLAMRKALADVLKREVIEKQ